MGIEPTVPPLARSTIGFVIDHGAAVAIERAMSQVDADVDQVVQAAIIAAGETRFEGKNRSSLDLERAYPWVMSKEQENKAVVVRWFTDFWGKHVDLGVVDEIAAPNMLLRYSLHEPRRGREDIKAFMSAFRAAFPDLNFWGTADLIAEGDYVVGQWEGGGTHMGPAFDDFLVGGLPAATGRKMHFTGTTVLKVIGGKIVEEIGLDDGVTALTQLGLLEKA